MGMLSLRHISSLHVLIVALALALASSGFAHRFVTPSDEAAVFYVESYGFDLSGLCGDPADGPTGNDCDACRLHAAMALPAPAVCAVIAQLDLDPVDWVAEPAILRSQNDRFARTARAPPQA